MRTAVSERVESIIGPSLEAMGYALVCARLFDGTHRGRLQVMIDRCDGRLISVDDCANASTAISALLDVEDPIAGAYDLEVSSPGLDRPLVKPEDFTRYANEEVKLETVLPIEGRKRFKGVLQGIDTENNVQMLVDGVVHAIAFTNVAEAKLVVTEAVVRRFLAAQKAQEKEDKKLRKQPKKAASGKGKKKAE